jgi:hypothetical protein
MQLFSGFSMDADGRISAAKARRLSLPVFLIWHSSCQTDRSAPLPMTAFDGKIRLRPTADADHGEKDDELLLSLVSILDFHST